MTTEETIDAVELEISEPTPQEKSSSAEIDDHDATGLGELSEGEIESTGFDRIENHDGEDDGEIDTDTEAGQLLKQLEARQDEVLEALERLDNQICEVLRDCGVTLDGESDDDASDAETLPLAA